MARPQPSFGLAVVDVGKVAHAGSRVPATRGRLVLGALGDHRMNIQDEIW